MGRNKGYYIGIPPFTSRYSELIASLIQAEKKKKSKRDPVLVAISTVPLLAYKYLYLYNILRDIQCLLC